MPIEPVRPKMRGLFVFRLFVIGTNGAAKVFGYFRLHAKPSGKAGAGLMQQHAQPVNNGVAFLLRGSGAGWISGNNRRALRVD